MSEKLCLLYNISTIPDSIDQKWYMHPIKQVPLAIHCLINLVTATQPATISILRATSKDQLELMHWWKGQPLMFSTLPSEGLFSFVAECANQSGSTACLIAHPKAVLSSAECLDHLMTSVEDEADIAWYKGPPYGTYPFVVGSRLANCFKTLGLQQEEQNHSVMAVDWALQMLQNTGIREYVESELNRPLRLRSAGPGKKRIFGETIQPISTPTGLSILEECIASSDAGRGYE